MKRLVLGLLIAALFLTLITGLAQPQHTRACGSTCDGYGIRLEGLWLGYWIDTVVEVPNSGYWTFSKVANDTNQYGNPTWSGTTVCTFHLNPGYAFVRWYNNGLDVSNISGYTVTVSNSQGYFTSYLDDHNGMFYLSALCDPSTVQIETKIATGFVWDTPAAAGLYTVSIGSYFSVKCEIASAYTANYEFGGWLGDSATMSAVTNPASMDTTIFITDVVFTSSTASYWIQPSLKSKAVADEASLNVFTTSDNCTVWYDATGYNANPGSGGSDNETVTGISIGSVVGIMTETTEPTNVFLGWVCTGCQATDATVATSSVIIRATDASAEATWGTQASQTYVVTVATGTGGTTSPVPGAYNYQYGTPCTLFAVPKSGYSFNNWGGGDPASYINGTEIEFTVTHAVTLTAYFIKDTGTATGPPAVTTGLWGAMLQSMTSVGLGNDMGRMMIIIVLMALAALVMHNNKTMRIVAPLGVLGLGIVGGWVPIWITVLLAVGAGIGFLGWFSKRSGAGT